MKLFKSKCCKCGCEVILKNVCLTEDTGEPICDDCKSNDEECIGSENRMADIWVRIKLVFNKRGIKKG